MVKIINAGILNTCGCPDTSALLKSVGKAEPEPGSGVQQRLQYSWQNPAELLEQVTQHKPKELSVP